jgi:glutamate synthase domain-containing protein 2/glutamate synthase domain-containing protein 1/glutamate synthase domain-containing protein 3
MTRPPGLPPRQGLYDPAGEHDACGVGFVANIRGEKSHAIVRQGIQVLENLTHRGATGADPDTGDGAGVLLQTPDGFLRRAAGALGIDLPAPGRYAAGLVFLSQDRTERDWQIETVERAVTAHGQRVLGWRDVPVDPQKIGPLAREVMPEIRQIFVGAADPAMPQDVFERRLYVIRSVAESGVRARGGDGARSFHVPSLSTRTLVYKGLLLAHQIAGFYPDLADASLESAIALVHQRYSTNTFPTWDLAQPFRYVAHNGEINTLRGNVNWMHAREGTLASDLFGPDLKRLFPIVRPGGSDTAQFDNVLELLVLAGRSLPHAMMMMVPEAWDGHESMDEDRRAFYEYHSCLLEPWDGPASMTFTDGRKIGALLDRNGLRPSRYTVTKDGLVVMASEAGALPIAPENVLSHGRLQPGRIFFVDTEQGRILSDEEIKGELVRRRPYRQWVAENRVKLESLPQEAEPTPMADEVCFRLQEVFGYTLEDLRIVLPPMVATGVEALGSMGDDTALACLSDRPRLLYHYFKQLFAQVTNPPIDSLLERLVMSTISTLGEERNLLDETPEHARLLELEHPILTNEQLARIRQIARPGFRAQTLSILFKAADGGAGLRAALDALCQQASAAVAEGVNLLILSDRGVTPELAPIPALLATAAVHHHLIREETRTKCGLVVETGEAREVGHFALLIGYGAGAVNPYLAFDTVRHLIEDGSYVPEDLTLEKALSFYIKAVDKGLLKIFAKMGISTLQSYRGAQIFEAVGLAKDLVARYFTGTSSKVSGVGLDVIARESGIRHARAFPSGGSFYPELDPGGLYQWRARGERHTFNPDSVAKLQHAVRSESFETFKDFSRAADDEAERLCTLRGLFRFRFADAPVPLEEVEPAAEIVKRFCTGAMSLGSISREAHETLGIAMNRLGGKSNTGEGGEDPARFTPDPSGDLRRSAIKQVASGRFGVTSWYLVNADEMQIKMAQGAKPGEGGQLPGHKVDEYIASIRHSTPGVGLISPPPHHDIYSIEDLSQLIHDLKNANPRGRVSVKLVSETGVGTVAAGVSKGKADGVLISGHDGGTGASPQTSIKCAGAPWEIGLAETQQTLVLNDLRGRIRVQADGGLKTGRDVVVAALLGADEFGFSTAPLVALGCILMRVCHLNTCPVGIATQNTELRKKFTGQPEHVVRYFFFVAEEVRELMAKLGFRRFEDMIGQMDRLEVQAAIEHWKAKSLDFSELLYQPKVSFDVRNTGRQEHGLEKALDNRLIELARPALEKGEAVEIHLPVRNVNRTVGTMLGSEVSRRYGAEGLPQDTIRIHLTGAVGQSAGAFLPKGVTLSIEGQANDYAGKGLSGGKIIVRVPPSASFVPEENVIVGNVVLYGATLGEAYFQGVAGERFCVRNSGATAVVEGVGDHGCEYMTGGTVVILGRTGRNFAAGMSGGIAYVLDEAGEFPKRCNLAMVELEEITKEDEETILRLVRRHFQDTRSQRAEEVLRKWNDLAAKFVKVFPLDYKRALADRVKAGSGNG